MSENSIGQILKDHYQSITAISEYERKVIRNIIDCRTQAMGGRVEKCSDCGHEIILYNSCRNRNCPNCQASQSRAWLEKRQKEVLPVSYYHGVFTIPSELNSLFLHNKRVCFDVLFKAVNKTLTQTAFRNLKLQIGFMSILHTWDQRLNFHPHIHCVIAGGGFHIDTKEWTGLKNKKYFLPVKVLSRVFKGKLLFYLNKAFRKKLLKTSASDFISACKTVSQKEWVVYLKRPFAGPRQVLKYLSCYTHRVGISNKRILKQDGKSVTFTWRDRKAGNSKKTLTIPAVLFVQRLLLHILPRRFVKIRFGGFMVNRLRKKMTEQCGKLNTLAANKYMECFTDDSYTSMTNTASICPKCQKGTMLFLGFLNTS